MKKILPILVMLVSGCGGPGPTTAPAPSSAEMAAPTGGGGGGPAEVAPTPTPSSSVVASPTPAASVAPTPPPAPSVAAAVGATPAPAIATPTPTPTPAPSAAANGAPTLEALTQAPLKISIGTRGTLSVRATDPEGDALSYVWQAEKGTITGSGASVSYEPDGSAGPGELDDVVTVSVSDGHHPPVTRSWPVDTFIGSKNNIGAQNAFTWDPNRAEYTQLFGDVTIEASGHFSVYRSVIVEYQTPSGRKLALAGPGSTTIRGVGGYMFVYLIGPTGAGAPAPDIALALNAPGQSAALTITQENVVGSQHAGHQILLSPGSRGHEAGETTARNGQTPYEALLRVRSWGLIGEPGYEDEGEISYALVRTGERGMGTDMRLASGDSDDRLLLTDTRNGLDDNEGVWAVYDVVYDE